MVALKFILPNRLAAVIAAAILLIVLVKNIVLCPHGTTGYAPNSSILHAGYMLFPIGPIIVHGLTAKFISIVLSPYAKTFTHS